MMRKTWVRIRTDSPTGSTPAPNSSSRTIEPSTATFALLDTSVVEKNSPNSRAQNRMSGYSTSVPCTWVDQFSPLAMTCSRLLAPAATYRTPGTCSRMASASSGVKLVAAPLPSCTPPRPTLPARTVIMLVPAA